MSNLHPIMEAALAPFVGVKSRKVKSWEQPQGDMKVKVEMWQDGPEAFEVACYRLGQGVPVLYRFSTFESADHHYAAFISFNQQTPDVESKLAAELEMLHSLCASAQCWLDAAAHLAKGYETKCALERNADAFRRAYAKITS